MYLLNDDLLCGSLFAYFDDLIYRKRPILYHLYTVLDIGMVRAKIRTVTKNRWADALPVETVVSMGNFRVLFSSKLEQYAAVVRWNPGSVRHLRHTGAQRLTYTSI